MKADEYWYKGIHRGSSVAVHFDPMMSQRPSYVAQRYNGTIQKVSKVVKFSPQDVYFELEDVTSDKGVPYGFTYDEIKKVDM